MISIVQFSLRKHIKCVFFSAKSTNWSCLFGLIRDKVYAHPLPPFWLWELTVTSFITTWYPVDKNTPKYLHSKVFVIRDCSYNESLTIYFVILTSFGQNNDNILNTLCSSVIVSKDPNLTDCSQNTVNIRIHSVNSCINIRYYDRSFVCFS